MHLFAQERQQSRRAWISRKPTVSAVWAALRAIFGDPRFVRTRQGMDVIPNLGQLSCPMPVQEYGVRIYQGRCSSIALWEPLPLTQLSNLRSTSYTSGIAETADSWSRSWLQRRLWRSHCTNGDDRAPESGEIDVPWRVFPNLYAGVTEQTLFLSTTRLILADHPHIGYKRISGQFSALTRRPCPRIAGHFHQRWTSAGWRYVLPSREVDRRELFFLGACAVKSRTL